MFQKQLFIDKNFYFLAGYHLSNSLANRFSYFCLPLFVYDVSQSTSHMTFTFGMSMVPYLLFSMFGGAVIDYIPRRKLLLILNGLGGFTLLIFSALISNISIKQNIEIIYTLSFLIALYNSIAIPAFEATLPEYFENKELIFVNSTVEFTNYMSNILSPLLAAFIVFLIGAKYALIFTSIFYISSFILISLSCPKRETFISKKFEELGQLLYEHFELTKEGILFIFRPECLIQLGIIMSASSNLILGAQEILIVLITENKFNIDEKSFGVIITSISLIAAFILPITIKVLNKYPIFSVMIVAIIIDSFANVLIGLSTQSILLFTFYCLSMVATSIYNVFWHTFRQSYVPFHMLGRVMGICRSLAYGFGGLGLLAGSALLNYVQANTLLIIGGIIMMIAGIASFCLRKFYPPHIFEKI